MSVEVTDPELLAKLNGTTPGVGAKDTKGQQEVTDPKLLAKLNGEVPVKEPHDKLPFMDRVHIAQADNLDEKELYFQNRYGKQSVTREFGADGQQSLVVNTPDGKKYRVGESGFVATLVGDLPELSGMTGGAVAGGMAGSVFGPEGTVLGGIIGAGIGAVAGKGAQEGVKAVKGEYKKTPAELAKSLVQANYEGEVGQMTGEVAGKAVTGVLTSHLPAFITGSTAESNRLAKEAWAKGGRVSYASMAPGLMKLRRIEIMDAKINSESVATFERNSGYILNQMNDTLISNGVPKTAVDQIVSEAKSPTSALSHEGVGEELKAGVRASIDSTEAAIDRTGKIADEHIDAQLAAVTKVIDRAGHEGLGEDAGNAIKSAKKDFSDAAGKMYGRIDNGLQTPVVSIEKVHEEVKRMISVMPPSEVSRIVREASALYKKPMSAEDAILLQEFGMEEGEAGGKITLEKAHNYRTALRSRGKADALTRSVPQGANLKIARILDESITDAAEDPAARPFVKALRDTDEWYAKNIGKFKDVAIRRLQKGLQTGMPRDPEGIMKIITSPGNSSRITTIRKIVGEGDWRRVQSVHMQKFLEDNATTRDMSGKPLLDGIKILQTLDKDNDVVKTFRAVHGEGSVEDLKEIGRMLASRTGKMDAEVLKNGTVKDALRSMKMYQARLDDFMKNNALRILSDNSKTGEEAYQWVASPGAQSESRLMAAVKLFGPNSAQMEGLRQAALEDVMRQTTIASIKKTGNNALEKALEAYTPKQMELLFPNGMGQDLRRLSRVIEFMFPRESGKAQDTAMAGMAAGFILQMPLFVRLPIQAYTALMRMLVQWPGAAKWLTMGHEAGEPWVRYTAATIAKMAAPVAAVKSMPSPPPQNAPAPPTVQ